MIWAIFWQTIRNRRLSWTVYSTIGLAFLLLYLFTFPAIQDQQAVYDQIMSSMPKAILDAFNISQSAPTLLGFLSAKHFGFTWALMFILLMIGYAGSALAKEVDGRTMGLLLSLPISRLKLYLIRLAAGAAGLSIFIVCSEIVVWPLAKLFNYAVSGNDVADIGLLGFFFGLAVLCLGLMFSALASESGKVYGAMGGLLLTMYVLNIVAGLQDKLTNLKYFSLFHYFTPGTVIDGGNLDATALLVFAAVSVVTAVIGAVAFSRRDITV